MTVKRMDPCDVMCLCTIPDEEPKMRGLSDETRGHPISASPSPADHGDAQQDRSGDRLASR
jgi:hypothetical protein